MSSTSLHVLEPVLFVLDVLWLKKKKKKNHNLSGDLQDLVKYTSLSLSTLQKGTITEAVTC